MRGTVVIGLLAGLGLLAVVSASSGSVVKRGDERVTGIPETKRLKVVTLKLGQETKNFRIGPGVYLLDGSPITPGSPIERYRELSKIMQAVWDLRLTTLPPDADKKNTDGYSKELYIVPAWLAMRYNPNTLSPQDLISGGNGVPVDEFGRTKPGEFGQVDNSLWGQTLGGLLKNPLFKAVVVGALIASGPQGMAAYGAYTMWESRGTDLTATNVVLTAGRAAAVSQCGPACGVAFDFGVGVASGKSYDKAAEDALMKELTPEQQVYYAEGKKVYRQVA